MHEFHKSIPTLRYIATGLILGAAVIGVGVLWIGVF